MHHPAIKSYMNTWIEYDTFYIYIPQWREQDTQFQRREGRINANSINVSLSDVDTEQKKEIQHVFMSGTLGEDSDKKFISTSMTIIFQFSVLKTTSSGMVIGPLRLGLHRDPAFFDIRYKAGYPV